MNVPDPCRAIDENGDERLCFDRMFEMFELGDRHVRVSLHQRASHEEEELEWYRKKEEHDMGFEEYEEKLRNKTMLVAAKHRQEKEWKRREALGEEVVKE